MRLDNYLVEKNFFDSRTKAKQAIERGEIILDGKIINKPSFFVDDNSSLKVEYVFDEKYVSLGGYKLKKALVDFDLNIKDLICLDIGASTGGFTDCLLKNGAKKVFAVDLNDSLLHCSLKEDSRVKSIIKNVKLLNQQDFDEDIDLVVADLSFISVSVALPIISSLISDGKQAVILIKPQFESETKTKYKNGIIRDKKTRIQACKKIYDCGVSLGLNPVGFTVAPISNDKNTEYLIRFIKNGGETLTFEQIVF